MDKKSIGKGVLYLYIEAITMLFSGYIYWLILSKIIDPSSIGLASTIIALATIVVSGASMGVAGGIQRFIGNSIAEDKLERIQGIINSSLLFTGSGTFVSILFIWILRDHISNYFDIDIWYIFLSVILFSFLTFAALLRAIIIPSLKVKIITIASIISTTIKFSTTIILVFFDYGVTGIIFGFLMYPIVSILIYIMAIRRTIYRNFVTTKLFQSTKEIFFTSFTFWIPGLISTIGSQLGTITVFVSVGSNNAGIYFVSFSLVTGIVVIVSVLSSIAYPTISALKDGRKRSIWRLIKISLILTLPISNALIFYSSDILSLFGTSYRSGSQILEILLLSSMPTAISTGIGVLLYSYGNNRQFLLLGLVTSLPRVLLYFIFVPILGGNGAALAYLTGSILGAIISIVIANRIGMNLYYKQIGILFLIPIIVAIPLKLLDLNYIISLAIILVFSYLIFVATKLINAEDKADILKILPPVIGKVITSTLAKISNRINRK